MKIGGFQKTSLLDYPDTISAIIWAVGCNFNCPFCYNPQLVKKTTKCIPEEEILSFLQKRKGLLEGVVMSGGEPLLQKDIVEFIEKIKKRGYLVKIDTNGTHPEKLLELIDRKLIDYIAMDVKAPKNKYNKLAGRNIDINLIQKSVQIIKKNTIDYEFRTTFIPDFLKKEDIVEIAKWLNGSKKFYLQQFKSDNPLLLSELEHLKPYPKEYLIDTIESIKDYFEFCKIRGT